MTTALLILNVGSSSLKFSLFTASITRIYTGQISGLQTEPHFQVKNNQNEIILDTICGNHDDFLNDPQAASLQILMTWLQTQQNYNITVIGHRVVHGGNLYSEPVIIDNTVITELEKLIPLAPLHQPYCLAAIKLFFNQYSNIKQIACFDTAFHATQSALTKTYAIPENIANVPIKRYGFHGLSYEYIVSVLPEYLGEAAAQGKIIIAHLGNGASLCAIDNKRSIATTMGLTALDGLVMGTRCGNIDPGVILYLLAEQKISVEKLTTLLYQQSGLLGISQISSDMQVLLNSSSPSANFAIDLFVYRLCREIGSLVAALKGLDSIIFTAGIGEHATIIRERICQQLSWLNIKIDNNANSRHANKISTSDSKIAVWIIPTDEESVIAQHASRLSEER